MDVVISYRCLWLGFFLAVNSNKGNGNQMPPTSGASAQNWQSSPPNMPNAQPNNNGAPTSNGLLTIKIKCITAWIACFIDIWVNFIIILSPRYEQRG